MSRMNTQEFTSDWIASLPASDSWSREDGENSGPETQESLQQDTEHRERVGDNETIQPRDTLGYQFYYLAANPNTILFVPAYTKSGVTVSQPPPLLQSIHPTLNDGWVPCQDPQPSMFVPNLTITTHPIVPYFKAFASFCHSARRLHNDISSRSHALEDKARDLNMVEYLMSCLRECNDTLWNEYKASAETAGITASETIGRWLDDNLPAGWRGRFSIWEKRNLLPLWGANERSKHINVELLHTCIANILRIDGNLTDVNSLQREQDLLLRLLAGSRGHLSDAERSLSWFDILTRASTPNPW